MHGNKFGRIKEGNKKEQKRRKQKNEKKRSVVCQIMVHGKAPGFAMCPRSGTRESELQIL